MEPVLVNFQTLFPGPYVEYVIIETLLLSNEGTAEGTDGNPGEILVANAVPIIEIQLE